MELIVRGYRENGEYFEERILRISHDQTIGAKEVQKELLKAISVKNSIPEDAPEEVADDRLIMHLRQQLERDPLERFRAIDAHTLNLIGEIALGESDSGTFTPQELAEKFHAHLEKVFWNRVCDEDGNRRNMIGCLKTSLTTTDFRGTESKQHPGFIPLGTVLIRRNSRPSEGVTFSFVWNPNVLKLYKC